MNYQVIGFKKDNLKKQIKEKGFSMDFISVLLGRNQNYLAVRIGRGSIPYQLANELAEILEVDWDEIFEIKKIREV